MVIVKVLFIMFTYTEITKTGKGIKEKDRAIGKIT